MLTGESLPVDKTTAPCPPALPLAELRLRVDGHRRARRQRPRGRGGHRGRHRVRRYRGRAEHAQPDTEFQVGLRRFSMLLVYVAGALTVSIFVINVVLQTARPRRAAVLAGHRGRHHPSAAAGGRVAPASPPARGGWPQRKVLVKRLVCIEDLGDIDVLFTDKTGTLTEGRIDFMRAVPGRATSREPSCAGARCAPRRRRRRAVGGNALDRRCGNPRPPPADGRRSAPTSGSGCCRSTTSARWPRSLVRDAAGTATLVTKGAPETVLARCVDVPAAAQDALAAEFAAGNRVVAVATRPAAGLGRATAADEHGLTLAGLLVFVDPPKADAAAAAAPARRPRHRGQGRHRRQRRRGGEGLPRPRARRRPAR